jgi:hypothetical protein
MLSKKHPLLLLPLTACFALAIFVFCSCSKGNNNNAGSTGPTVTLTTPKASDVFTAPATITITANAQDGDGISKVFFLMELLNLVKMQLPHTVLHGVELPPALIPSMPKQLTIKALVRPQVI